MLLGQQLNSHGIFKRLAKALIRLRVCAGCSEALLVAHTTLLEISCCGSNIVFFDLKIVFTFTNSVDTDEMQHYSAFHLGLHCLH